MAERLAVIMAHADDAEIWAGGALINHHDRGDEILLINLIMQDEIRKREASATARQLNAEIKFIEDIPNISDLVSLIVRFAPSVIITHWEYDTHHEHFFVFQTVSQITPVLIIDHAMKFNLYSCDTYNSIGRELNTLFVPTDYIDVTDIWDRKMDLIASHSSQPISYWQKMVEQQNRIHGARTGVEYAEGYVQIPVLGRVRGGRKYLNGS